jgi:hypothetical protein
MRLQRLLFLRANSLHFQTIPFRYVGNALGFYTQGGELDAPENEEKQGDPELCGMWKRVYTIPVLAEVLLGQMPLEELGQEASPLSDSSSRNRWTGQISQTAEAKTRLKAGLAIREGLVSNYIVGKREGSRTSLPFSDYLRRDE